ncbi:MFS transporter [Methylovirgula sp. 4M-Z18]|nr:MFS transporter [Methylovirgula sp. 4M-Z18]
MASPSRARAATLTAAILASSLGFMDGAVVTVAIPAIRSDIGADFGQIQWVSNGYALMLSALILVGGAAGDRFGQRETFGAGILVFCLTSLGCATAGSPEPLIIWRCLQGAGAAFMVPGSLALIALAFPTDERGRAIGLWSMVSGIAAALGPIVAGTLIQFAGPTAWRWIFWINLPAGALTLFLLFALTPRHRPKAGTHLDLLGAAIVTIGLGGLALGLTFASEPSPSPRDIGLALAIGVAAMVLFWLWERRSKVPMLPRALFALRTFNGANLLTFCLYFALAGSLFFLPMTLIEALQLGAAKAGSVYLPFTLTMALLARYSGALSDRRGPRLPIALGSVIVGLSFLTVAAGVAAGAYEYGVLPSMALLGIGMGFVVPPLSTTVMTVADEGLAGTASGINNGVARIAGLFAVAALGIVAALAYRLNIDADLASASYGEPAHADWPPAALAVRAHAMIVAFAAVSVATAALSFASAIVAWRMLPQK